MKNADGTEDLQDYIIDFRKPVSISTVLYFLTLYI